MGLLSTLATGVFPDYPTPVQFCHELPFYFFPESQFGESHPGFLFFCKPILQPDETATSIEPGFMNVPTGTVLFFNGLLPVAARF
jgi:hypothetical protein